MSDETHFDRLVKIADDITLGMQSTVHVGLDDKGAYLQIRTWRKDVITKEFGWGYGGTAYPTEEQSDGQIVQMIFGLFQGYWIHEVRENFEWRGRRVFGPHTKIEALWEAAGHVDVPSAMHVGERPPQPGAEQEQDQ